MSNITPIPKQDASELRKAIEAMKRAMPEQLELALVLARMDHAKFEAYQTAGFTAAQALELLKAEKIRAHV
jgi:hypothetical protein